MSKTIKALLRWVCSLTHFGNLKIVKRLSDSCFKLQCPKCKALYAINLSAQCILPWDLELANFYDDLAAFPKGR